jgi:hypothetical protein
MIRKSKIALTMLAAAVIASPGAAFTDGNSPTRMGYGSYDLTTVSASSIVYGFDSTGAQITDAVILLTGDYQAGYLVSAGFEGGILIACTMRSYSSPSTAVTCSGFTQPTSVGYTFTVITRSSRSARSAHYCADQDND